MRQLALSMLALALGAAAAVALVACGGGEDAKLLPGNTAQEITANLDRVQQYAEEGECVGAEDAAAEVNAQVETIADVDPKLKEALQRGADRLGEVIATCDEATTEAEEAPTEETTTTEEAEKIPPGQEKKAEKELEKEEKEREKEEERVEKEAEREEKEAPPAETQPAETPSEGGGPGASGGVGPGTPATPEAGDEG